MSRTRECARPLTTGNHCQPESRLNSQFPRAVVRLPDEYAGPGCRRGLGLGLRQARPITLSPACRRRTSSSTRSAPPPRKLPHGCARARGSKSRLQCGVIGLQLTAAMGFQRARVSDRRGTRKGKATVPSEIAMNRGTAESAARAASFAGVLMLSRWRARAVSSVRASLQERNAACRAASSPQGRAPPAPPKPHHHGRRPRRPAAAPMRGR